jgi:hypothetical protein
MLIKVPKDNLYEKKYKSTMEKVRSDFQKYIILPVNDNAEHDN